MGGLLWQMTLATVRSPRDGIQQVLRLMLPRQALYISMVLVIVLSMAVLELAAILNPLPAGAPDPEAIFGGPFLFFLMQVLITLGGAGVMYVVGQWFDGDGAFEACLTAMVWLSWMSLVLQSLAVVAALIITPLAPFISAFTIGFLLVALAVFIAEVHGFTNLVFVAFGAIAAVIGIAFLMAIVLMIIGFQPAIAGVL